MRDVLRVHDWIFALKRSSLIKVPIKDEDSYGGHFVQQVCGVDRGSRKVMVMKGLFISGRIQALRDGKESQEVLWHVDLERA